MKIGDHEVGRVAILVLDYPNKEENPSEAVTSAYILLEEQLETKYKDREFDLTVLANEELVARHRKDFEKIGFYFFPDWRNSNEYRDLLREGLRQGTDIYVMQYVDDKDIECFLCPVIFIGTPESKGQLEITNLESRVDIKPNPDFKYIKPFRT